MRHLYRFIGLAASSAVAQAAYCGLFGLPLNEGVFRWWFYLGGLNTYALASWLIERGEQAAMRRKA